MRRPSRRLPIAPRVAAARGRLLLVGLAALALTVGPGASGALADAPGALDAAFSPNANGPVYSVAVQGNGRILIGGDFTAVGGTTRYRVARLNANGTVDPSFAPNVNNEVYAFAEQPDGKVIIAGRFTCVGVNADADCLDAGEAPRNRIARINADGTLDTTFDPNVNDQINALALQQDGRIILAGYFTAVAGTARNRIARLNADGTLDTAFNPNADASILALALLGDGRTIIGGNFTAVAGTSRNRIARLNADGTLDAAFNPSANGSVSAVAVQADGKAMVAGDFSAVAGVPRTRAARLNPDGSVDTAFGDPAIGGTVLDLATQVDGKAIIVGAFTTVAGTTRNRIARLNADGTLDTAFNPDASNLANEAAVQTDGRVVVAGTFQLLGGVSRPRIGRVLGTTPQAAPTGVEAVAGDRSATASWTAVPGEIAGYTATASPGGATCTTTTATTCLIPGLANDTAYTITVTASNPFGPGPVSKPSAAVTPLSAAASIRVTKPTAKVTRTTVVVTSRVTVTGAGRISQTATTGKARRVVRCRIAKAVPAAGTYTLRCNLGAKGRTALRLRALKLTLRTVFTPTGADALTADRPITVKRRR